MVSMMKIHIHMKPSILNHADTPSPIVLLMIKESGFNVQSVDLCFIHDLNHRSSMILSGPLNPDKVLPCVQKVTKNVWLILWNMLVQFLLLLMLQIHLSNFTNLEFTTNQTVRHKILIMVFSPLVSEKKMVTRYVTKPVTKTWPKTSQKLVTRAYLISKSDFEFFEVKKFETFKLSKIEIIIWWLIFFLIVILNRDF